MKWVLRKAFRTSVICVAAVIHLSGANAGDGTLAAGTPSKLNLSVYFEYPERSPNDWRPLFEQASGLLYNATEGKVQLGYVSVFNNCPAKKKSPMFT